MFFFQAEDGIRDIGVTGVQTCALPIYRGRQVQDPSPQRALVVVGGIGTELGDPLDGRRQPLPPVATPAHGSVREDVVREADGQRSEERRGGKECRSRWSPYH